MPLMMGQSGDGTAIHDIADNRADIQAINLMAKASSFGADLGAVIRAGIEGPTRAATLLSAASLSIQACLNGEVMQNGNTDDTIFKVEQ